MKAICPNCQAAYRVADEKVPDTGAQIKCPKCEHTFIVKRPQPPQMVSSSLQTASAVASSPPPLVKKTVADASAPKPEEDLFGSLPSVSNATSMDVSHTQSTPPDALSKVADRSGTGPKPATGESKSSITPNLDALSGEAFISVAPKSELELQPRLAQRSSSRGVSAIRAQSSTSSLLDGYRVRTSRGLTYDFPSEQAMLRWLDERDDIEGYQAAEPGGNWVSVEKLLGVVSSSQVVSSPMAPHKITADRIKTGENLDPSEPIKVQRIKPLVPVLPGTPVPGGDTSADSYSKIEGPKAGLGLWIGIFVAFLLLVATASVSLTRYGLVDLSSVFPLEKVGISFPKVEHGSKQNPLGDIKVARDRKSRQAVFSKALVAGRRALASKKFSRAALEFNRAIAVHPGSAKALDGLARAFMGLGDAQRAKQVMKKARAIGGR